MSSLISSFASTLAGPSVRLSSESASFRPRLVCTGRSSFAATTTLSSGSRELRSPCFVWWQNTPASTASSPPLDESGTFAAPAAGSDDPAPAPRPTFPFGLLLPVPPFAPDILGGDAPLFPKPGGSRTSPRTDVGSPCGYGLKPGPDFFRTACLHCSTRSIRVARGSVNANCEPCACRKSSFSRDASENAAGVAARTCSFVRQSASQFGTR
mmetsp:Transcript_7747/g.18738  ORF Transcript_7747/g.18738 Transcript_7747/m.18738 type:complete len:211 (-) Transcript_7747:147-779(-)